MLLRLPLLAVVVAAVELQPRRVARKAARKRVVRQQQHQPLAAALGSSLQTH